MKEVPHSNKQDLYTYQVQRWQRRKESVVAQLGGKCQSCGYDRCIAALELHHVDPLTKEMNWSKMRLLGEAKLQAELSKCILLCANCHREVHWAHS